MRCIRFCSSASAIDGPFADVDQPQGISLKSNGLLVKERQVAWKSAQHLSRVRLRYRYRAIGDEH